MNRFVWWGLLLGWLLLHPWPGANAAGGGGHETVALGPRFRFPLPAKQLAPSKPSGVPKATPPTAAVPASQPPATTRPSAASPAQAAAQQKPATPSSPTTRGLLDPKVAQSLFDQRMAQAKQRYPHLYGKPKQEHHVTPVYLGGSKAGQTVVLDPAYHQLVTNAFRQRYGYGQKIPDAADLQDILRHVYKQYPLPGIHF